MSLTESASHATRDDATATRPMGAPGCARPEPASPHAVQLPLRLAQRAFAALLEHAARNHDVALTLHGAQLRSAARRALSALSADDRACLVRWLALQIAVAAANPNDSLPERVDAILGGHVAAVLARTREELAAPRRAEDVAAA